MMYLLIKRKPRMVFEMSGVFVGNDLADAKREAVESIFGTGLPNTPDEILERYNVDVVELDDEWEQKYDEFGLSYPECPDPKKLARIG